ncbi:MAG: hypothetical protein HYV03_07950 [Deltaproteobacteria bacterium]|nr:hypothetical protein [Deltaproteobacteria bacterium]
MADGSNPLDTRSLAPVLPLGLMLTAPSVQAGGPGPAQIPPNTFVVPPVVALGLLVLGWWWTQREEPTSLPRCRDRRPDRIPLGPVSDPRWIERLTPGELRWVEGLRRLQVTPAHPLESALWVFADGRGWKEVPLAGQIRLDGRPPLPVKEAADDLRRIAAEWERRIPIGIGSREDHLAWYQGLQEYLQEARIAYREALEGYSISRFRGRPSAGLEPREGAPPLSPGLRPAPPPQAPLWDDPGSEVLKAESAVPVAQAPVQQPQQQLEQPPQTSGDQPEGEKPRRSSKSKHRHTKPGRPAKGLPVSAKEVVVRSVVDGALQKWSAIREVFAGLYGKVLDDSVRAKLSDIYWHAAATGLDVGEIGTLQSWTGALETAQQGLENEIVATIGADAESMGEALAPFRNAFNRLRDLIAQWIDKNDMPLWTELQPALVIPLAEWIAAGISLAAAETGAPIALLPIVDVEPMPGILQDQIPFLTETLVMLLKSMTSVLQTQGRLGNKNGLDVSIAINPSAMFGVIILADGRAMPQGLIKRREFASINDRLRSNGWAPLSIYTDVDRRERGITLVIRSDAQQPPPERPRRSNGR